MSLKFLKFKLKNITEIEKACKKFVSKILIFNKSLIDYKFCVMENVRKINIHFDKKLINQKSKYKKIFTCLKEIKKKKKSWW